MRLLKLTTSFILITTSILWSQQNTPWVTLIHADTEWAYTPCPGELPENWTNPEFDDHLWQKGIGGIGYGDGDDSTLIDPVKAVLLRKAFHLQNISTISQAVLNADYDDAFIAYINGVEIARANISPTDSLPGPLSKTNHDREAILIHGGQPEYFELNKRQIEQILKKGENTLAIHLINQVKTSSDLTGLFFFSIQCSEEYKTKKGNPDWFTPPVVLTESNLPIIKIETNDRAILDDPRIRAQMVIINDSLDGPNYIQSNKIDYSGQTSIELRGSSSQKRFPKKSYGLETQNEDGTNNNVSLLGMPKENDWILYGPYSDKSLLRNVLIYELSRKIGQYAPRTRLCELVINDKYQGVYILMEKIKRDKQRVAISKLKNKDITGGYILKIDKTTGAGSKGWHSSIYPKGRVEKKLFFQYEYPDEDDITPAQTEYIQNHIREFEQLLASSNYNDPVYGYDKFISVESFIDFFILNEIAYNLDGYRLSTFLYKDRDKKDPLLKVGPIWDFNLAFGNGYDCKKQNSEGFVLDYNITCPNKKNRQIPFWWHRLMEDPQYNTSLYKRWTALRAGPLQLDSIYDYIDKQAALLADAQERNFRRWRVMDQKLWPNKYHSKSYTEEIQYLKEWIRARLIWLDHNIPGNTYTSTDDAILNIPTSKNKVSYHNGMLYFSMPDSQEVTISLIDSTGTLLKVISEDKVIQAGHNKLPLLLNAHSKGVYLIKIDVGETTYLEKILNI